jgi:hypothetical protein
MRISAALVAHRQPTEACEPGQGAFDHPAMASEALARLNAPPRDAGDDATLATGRTTACVIIPFIGVQLGGAPTRPTTPARGLPERWTGIQHDLQQLRVMDIGRREPHRERDSVSVDHKMALRARFAAVRGIRSSRFAPLLAATLAESSEARDQSSFSASASRWSRTWCKRSHTPACCQSRSRRQQVIPLPQPSSCGSISQLMPLLSTNKMPVNAARSLMRGRPPFGFAGSGGSNGPTTAQSSSLTRGLLIPPVYHRFC